MIPINFNPDEFLIPGKALFVPQDFKDVAGLVQKFQMATEPVSQYLLTQCSAQTVQEIQQFDGSQVAIESLAIKLSDDFNKVLTSNGLWDKKRFTSTPVHDGTLIPKVTNKSILPTLKDDNLIAFNRVLLDKSYASELEMSPAAEWRLWVALGDIATLDVIDQWETWRDDWRKQRAAGGVSKSGEFKASLDDDIWKGFRDWLLEHVFHHKCAYCETPFAGFIGDAEHFRPKGEVSMFAADGSSKIVTVVDEDNNTIAHPGYFWLAYHWQNLLPSCHLCNRYGGKKTLFPVEKSHIAVRKLTIPEMDHLIHKSRRSPRSPDVFYLEPLDLDAQEGRLLLHPYYDEPEQHLYFEAGGKVATWRNSNRGIASIRVYDLNNVSKIRERDKEQRAGFQHYLATISGTKVDINEWKKAVQELRDEYYKGERAYAVAVFDYVHEQLEGTDIDPDRLLSSRRR